MQKEQRLRFFGIMLLLVAVLLNMASSIAITNFTISDNNPTSYIIVPMLMGLLLILFYAKDTKLVVNPKRNDLIIATLIFVFYIILLSYSRLALSYLFMTYRIDMLLMPLFIVAVITAIFGVKSINRFKLLIIYMLFSSPIILIPILNMSSTFALFNANIVYSVLKGIGIPVVSNGIVITAPSNYSISIATTCVDIGAFIALILFLIPISYLYNGKITRKLLWLTISVILMLILNILRMISIAILWAYYGITSAVASAHIFAGPILFYLTIIIMVIIIGKFKLSFSKDSIKKELKHKAYSKKDLKLWKFAIIPIAFGLMGLYMSMPYLNALNANYYTFGSSANPSYPILDRIILGNLGNSEQNVTQLSNIEFNTVYTIGNNKNSTDLVYTIVNQTNLPSQIPLGLVYNYSVSSSSLLLNSGISYRSLAVYSNNRKFYLNFFSVPTNISNSTFSIRYGFFKEIQNNTNTTCNANIDISTQNYIESYIYNLLNGNMNSKISIICPSIYVANSIVQ